MTDRLVVIGGDAGGMSAASQARRRRGPDALTITAFERGRYTSYSACGIPYFVGRVVDDVDRLIARAPETFRDRFAIDVHLGHEVVAVDTANASVEVRDLATGATRTEPYDDLVIATGAIPIRPPLPGVDAEGVFGVQTLGDGLAIDEFIARIQPARAVVVGAGYIGLEMAEALVLRGMSVTLVDSGTQVMGTLDADMARIVEDAARGLGIDVRLGDAVTGFESDGGGVTAVAVAGGGPVLPAEIVVLGIGVRPNVGLARDAGVVIGPSGAIAVDNGQRTNAERVWAAGDCTEVFHRVSRQPTAIALGTHANKQGRVAGINIGGGSARFRGVVGTAVSKICAYEVARTGLKTAEAQAAGFEVVTAAVESTTRAGYFPGAAPITTKIVAERGTGRLLGGQIVGQEGAAKRIDVLATALWNEMTVDEIAGLDLAYAPPFSPVWDPVLVAARKAAEAVG